MKRIWWISVVLLLVSGCTPNIVRKLIITERYVVDERGRVLGVTTDTRELNDPVGAPTEWPVYPKQAQTAP